MLRQNKNRLLDEHPNILMVRSLLEGVLDVENVERYDHFFSQSIRLHGPMIGDGVFDLSVGKNFDLCVAKAFKRHRIDLSEVFAHEDKVVVYWTLHAIRRGDDKGIVFSGTSIYRISNGKIVEIWHSWDRLGLLEQLGEVRVCSDLVHLESDYDTLKELGMEKYAERALCLSTRERQCLHYLLEGKTAKETARQLKLSFRTVESYFENIKAKLHCDNKRELLKMAQILLRLMLL